MKLRGLGTRGDHENTRRRSKEVAEWVTVRH